jgi:hypothetical protein
LSDAAALHSVLLDTARPLDAPALGRALSGILGLAQPDAVRRARYCGGILLDGVPLEQAEDALAELRPEGIGARVVPAEVVPPVAKPKRLAPNATSLPEGTAPVLAIAFALDTGLPPARAQTLDPESLLAGEDHGHEPETLRLIAGVARRRREERRETSLGLDIVLEDRRVLRLERAAPAFIPAARALLASLPATVLRAAENEVLLGAGALEAALFLHADELARYERWLLAPPRTGDR